MEVSFHNSGYDYINLLLTLTLIHLTKAPLCSLLSQCKSSVLHVINRALERQRGRVERTQAWNEADLVSKLGSDLG